MFRTGGHDGDRLRRLARIARELALFFTLAPYFIVSSFFGEPMVELDITLTWVETSLEAGLKAILNASLTAC